MALSILATSPTWPMSIISGSSSSGVLAGDGHFAGANQIAILAGQPQPATAVTVILLTDLFVDQTANTHFTTSMVSLSVTRIPSRRTLLPMRLSRLPIWDRRHAPPLGDAHSSSARCRGRSCFSLITLHGVPPYLNDEGLAVIAADVGRASIGYGLDGLRRRS